MGIMVGRHWRCDDNEDAGVYDFWNDPERVAARAEMVKVRAANAAAAAAHQRELAAWRDQLLAERDPVKAAIPIDNDALLREQQARRSA